MTIISQRDASKRWGISRGAIQRAIRAGRLSASEGSQIEVSEMIRVFGEPGAEPADGAKEAGGEAIEVVRLKAENAGLRAVIEAKDETIRTQADALLRLTGPKADPVAPASTDPTARRVLIALAVFTALVIAAVAFDLPSRIL
jgi:hypothetical protein